MLLFLSSQAIALEVVNYHISKGSLHKGGVAKVEVTTKSKKAFVTKMSYEIFKKSLVPIPSKVLRGETVISMPPEFSTAKGYQKLEKKGVMEIDKAKLQFVKKTSWRGLSGAYNILILPKNGKTKIEVLYHPTIKAAGWARVIITFISPYPILNGYNAVIEVD